MFHTLYNFYYEWLFSGTAPAYMSSQGAEFTTILFCVVTLLGVLALAFIPIKALCSFIINWRS